METISKVQAELRMLNFFEQCQSNDICTLDAVLENTELYSELWEALIDLLYCAANFNRNQNLIVLSEEEIDGVVNSILIKLFSLSSDGKTNIDKIFAIDSSNLKIYRLYTLFHQYIPRNNKLVIKKIKSKDTGKYSLNYSINETISLDKPILWGGEDVLLHNMIADESEDILSRLYGEHLEKSLAQVLKTAFSMAVSKEEIIIFLRLILDVTVNNSSLKVSALVDELLYCGLDMFMENTIHSFFQEYAKYISVNDFYNIYSNLPDDNTFRHCFEDTSKAKAVISKKLFLYKRRIKKTLETGDE